MAYLFPFLFVELTGSLSHRHVVECPGILSATEKAFGRLSYQWLTYQYCTSTRRDVCANSVFLMITGPE